MRIRATIDVDYRSAHDETSEPDMTEGELSANLERAVRNDLMGRGHTPEDVVVDDWSVSVGPPTPASVFVVKETFDDTTTVHVFADAATAEDARRRMALENLEGLPGLDDMDPDEAVRYVEERVRDYSLSLEEHPVGTAVAPVADPEPTAPAPGV